MAYIAYLNGAGAGASENHLVLLPAATYHGNRDTYEFQFVLKVEGGSASIIPINAASGFSNYIMFGVSSNTTRVRYNGTTLQWNVNAIPDDGNYHLMRVIRRVGGEHEIIRHQLDEQGQIVSTVSLGTVTNTAKTTTNFASFGRTSGGTQSYRMKWAKLLDAEDGNELHDWQPDGLSFTVIDSVGGATATPVGTVTFEEYVASNNDFLLDADLQYGVAATGTFENLTSLPTVMTIDDGVYSANVSVSTTGTTSSGTFTTAPIPLPAEPTGATSIEGNAWQVGDTVTLTLDTKTTESAISLPSGYASVVMGSGTLYTDILTNSGWPPADLPVAGDLVIYETAGNTVVTDEFAITTDVADAFIHMYLLRPDSSIESFTIAVDVNGDITPPSGDGIPVASRVTPSELYKYLLTQGYSGNINDVIYGWLGDEGFSGNVSDRWYGYLRGLGYTGAIPDMLYSWRKDL